MSKADQKHQRLIIGGIPRAELLPPEIKQDKVAASQRSGLVVVLVLVTILVGLAYAGSTAIALAADLGLQAEQERGAELLAQQAEFVEVKELKASLTAAQTSILIASAPEVDWSPFIADYLATLPAGAKIESFSVTFTPEALGTVPSPINPPGLFEIIAVVNTPSIPDSSAWMSRLSKLPGFNDYSPSSLTTSPQGFATTVKFHLSVEALWARYYPDREDSSDTTTDDTTTVDTTTDEESAQ